MTSSGQNKKCEIEGHSHLTWSSGVRSAVRYAEGLSARNTQGGQDEEAE